jgi:hypothetical protein
MVKRPMHLAQLCGNVPALCGDCVGWVNLSLGSIIKGQLESDKKKASSTILKIPVIQNFHRLHSPISAEAFSVDQFPFFHVETRQRPQAHTQPNSR